MHRTLHLGVPLLAASAAITTAAVLLAPGLAHRYRDARIRAHGVPVPAVITAVADDGTRVDGNPELRITVRVLRPDGRRTLARLRAVVPTAVATDLAAGEVLRVRFDADYPERVVLDRPPAR